MAIELVTKRLSVITTWSEEDGGYIARLLRRGYADEELEKASSRLSKISAFGETRVRASKEFQVALRAAIEVLEEDTEVSDPDYSKDSPQPQMRYSIDFKGTYLGTFETKDEATSAKEGADIHERSVRREISKQIRELSRDVGMD